MKKLLFIAMCIASSTILAAQGIQSTKGAPLQAAAHGAYFTWALTTFDFGKIEVGVPVSHTFTFLNTGDSPLVISSVEASCGCTVTAYSQEPIPAGETGFVKATYNAATAGIFAKTVTVNANTPESLVKLTIKGEVVE